MSGGVLLQIASKFDPKGITEAKSGLDRLQSAGKAFATISTVAFAAAAAGAVAFGIESVRAAAHSESVARSLEQIAKNSGVFGSTAEEVKKASAEIMDYTRNLSNLTGIDDEILNSIVRGWLAVPEFAAKGVKGIEGMIKVVTDVAAGTGKDVQAIGLAFIKVAGDEENALGKLMRQGIIFTDSQKEMYKSILKTSGEVAAQDYLIGELGKTYAGAAEAAANPFDVLTQNVKNLQEQVGVYLLPALQLFIDKIRELINSHGPELEAMFKGIGDFAVGFVNQLSDISNWVTENPDALNNIALGVGGITLSLIALDGALKGNPIGLLVTGLSLLGGAIVTGAIDFQVIGKKLNDFWKDTLYNFAMATDTVVNGIIDMLNTLFTPMRSLLGLMNDVFGTNFDVKAIEHISAYMNMAIADLQSQGISYGWQTSGALPTGYGQSGTGRGGLRPMATGGIVMGPTPALVGEAGPEAIIPLDRLSKMGGNSYNINVTAGVGDPAAIGQQIVTYIKKFERSGGPIFVSA